MLESIFRVLKKMTFKKGRYSISSFFCGAIGVTIEQPIPIFEMLVVSIKVGRISKE
jgi:hypothetical protein